MSKGVCIAKKRTFHLLAAEKVMLSFYPVHDVLYIITSYVQAYALQQVKFSATHMPADN